MASPELRRRLAVAGVGVPAVVALLWAGSWWIAVPVAVLAGLGAGELCTIARAGGVRPFRGPVMLAAAGLVLLAAAAPSFTEFAPWALGGLGALLLVSLTLPLGLRSSEEGPLGAAAVTVAGALYIGLPLAVVPLIHALPEQAGWGGASPSRWVGMFAVALPVAATWVGDSAAYFVGSAVGRRKLAPSISPGKSVEGSLGGLVGAGVAAAIWFGLAHPFLPDFPFSLVTTVGIGVVLAGAGQAGDLVESLLKREAGVKDSGGLFPGHGGVLDRLDALTFSLPLGYAVLALPGAFA